MTATNDIFTEERQAAPPDTDFSALYMSLRKKEKRVYTDTEVAALPDIRSAHVHYKEWQIRKKSAAKIYGCLQNKKSALAILEVGCGNGWLSAKLAGLENSRVCASDINEPELTQAKRVFKERSNIDFICRDIRSPYFSGFKFDVIVFAASIQYFSSFDEIMQRALELLKDNGEIYITDSFFYADAMLAAAKKRTEIYFELAGFPEMSEFYFHHSRSSLKKYLYSLLYSRGFLSRNFRDGSGLFSGIIISKK